MGERVRRGDTESGRGMIELFVRTFIPAYPSTDWHDELLYYGSDRDEAQRLLCAREFADNELAVWTETHKKCAQCHTQTGDNISR